jgi:hypothetical protein
MNPNVLKLPPRLRLPLATAVVGIAAILGWTYFLQEQALAATPLREFGVASLAQRIREARGHVLVLVLYDPGSDDAYLVGDLRRWAAQARPSVKLLALAVGKRRDAQGLFRYAHERGVQRIAPEWLAPWQPGTFEQTMGELGVIGPDRWSPPLVAVFDPAGKVTAQWEGEADYVEILAAAKAARQLAATGGLGK